MSSLWFTLEVMCGASVADAARDLCELADRLDVPCEAKFNDVMLRACPGDNPDKIVENYWHIASGKSKVRLAMDMSRRYE